jgi:hypothetical protein
MLAGEILVRNGKLDEGLSELSVAVNAEDALRYDEPPGWILPVRHSLGANLMQRVISPKQNRFIARISYGCQRMAGRSLA